MNLTKPYLILFFAIAFLLMTGQKGMSQNPSPQEPTYILFLLDASGSMQTKWAGGATRMQSAKKILLEMADSLNRQENVFMALRVYGHTAQAIRRDCRDTRLELSFSDRNLNFIRSKIDQIKPLGITPIAYSLEKAAGDFPVSGGKNIIILMTDGEESCGGDPCEVGMALEKQGIVLKHFVIGIGVSSEVAKLFQCFGTYYDAQTPQALKESLTTIVKKVTNYTTAQVRLLDEKKKPSETDLAMTLTDIRSGISKYNLYHTLAADGLADSFKVEPVNAYDLRIHSVPPVEKKNVEFVLDKHNVVEVTTPTGFLEVSLDGPTISQNVNNKLKALLRQPGNTELLAVQDFNTSQRYLAGRYDLDLLTIPRQSFRDKKVETAHTTTLSQLAPGIVTITKKFDLIGGIFILEEGSLRKVYELNTLKKIETIALQPGSYTIIFRPRYARSMHSSQDKVIEVQSGRSLSITL